MTENMRSHLWKRIAVVLAMALLVVAAGCKKKVPPPPSLPPGSNNSPIGGPSDTGRSLITSFTAEPRTIAKGQSSTLRWSITGATDMSIDQGIGAVQSNGSRQVFPSVTTTYTLIANGPAGNDTKSVTVEVSTPPPPPPPGDGSRGPILSSSQLLSQQGQDAYFDYDKSDIRPDAADALRHDAELLKQIFQQDPNVSIIVEGHCDERGSAEYNLALGDRRAAAAVDFLVQLGVPAGKMSRVSFGKDKPQCTDATEDCYQKNRRAHLAVGQ
jgi:peptidoglycan-associated lipoprotein